MSRLYYVKAEMLLAILLQQATLQERIMEAQEKIIALQERIDNMTPKNLPDKEVYWHLASEGILSSEAANSNDVATVRKFRDWNVNLAKKHIQPYVSPKVYSECLSQMTRGLSERIAKLETEKEAQKQPSSDKPSETNSNKSSAQIPQQLSLIPIH